MKIYRFLGTTFLVYLISLMNISNLYAKSISDANSEDMNISYNLSYNVNMNQNLNDSFDKYNVASIDSNFAKDKFGKLISFNDEKIQNEKILDLVGMFTSRYDSRKKFRLKIRLDNDYKLQKASISYKITY